MEQAEIYRALGMDPPSGKPAAAKPESSGPQGENGQAVAGSAHGTTEDSGSRGNPSSASVPSAPSPQGEGGPSSASVPSAPSPQGEGGLSSASQSEAPSTEGEGFGQEMPKEERARQARMRREREQKAAVDAAVRKANQEAQEKADREMAELLKELGLTNRYRENQPITTRDELRQWQQDARDEKLRQRLKSGQLTQEDLQQAAQSSPEVQELKAQVQKLQQQEAARQRQAAEAQIQKELSEIRALDPTIKTVKDVLDLPTGQEFSRLVQERGMTFVEAFRLANAEKLQKTQQRAAEEAQARNYHSKDHLIGVGSRAGTPVSIPKKTYDVYRMLRPEMTDEQIRADYAKRQKGRK